MKSDARLPNLTTVDHPLVQQKLTLMRDQEKSTRTFRELLREPTMLMGYELTCDLPLTNDKLTMPLAAIIAPVMARDRVFSMKH